MLRRPWLSLQGRNGKVLVLFFFFFGPLFLQEQGLASTLKESSKHLLVPRSGLFMAWWQRRKAGQNKEGAGLSERGGEKPTGQPLLRLRGACQCIYLGFG